MDDIRIDDHKLTRHPIETGRWLQARGQWKGVRDIYPIYVEISPYGGCNFRCTFCAKDFLQYKPTKIAPAVLSQNLEVMAKKGVKSVLFAGEGEPLLYKELGEIFKLSPKIGLDMALNSNMAVPNWDALTGAARHAKWIRASVNAGNSKVHSEIHKCKEDVFEKVLTHLAFAVDERNRSGSRTVIGAQAVLVDENKDSMVDLARRSKQAGVDYLVIKPYSQHPESFTHVHENADYKDAEELGRRLEEEQTENFKVFFRRSAFSRAAAKTHAYPKCLSVPVFWAYIRSTGDVSGCNAFLTDEKFRYGNINESTFDQIWEGPRREKYFEYMKTHDIHKCRVNCRMDKVNEYLHQLQNPALHDNYI